ncbi:hypothetical protein N7G274_001875 [Stereocaulon virgatum]|uniref:F-box domain-containing protein n=1 Tax=Stereocaulon virgatum TaxID=373712 RepID=A0ABR4AMU2_9LECA
MSLIVSLRVPSLQNQKQPCPRSSSPSKGPLCQGPLLTELKTFPTSTLRARSSSPLRDENGSEHLITSESPTLQRTERYDCAASPIEKLPTEISQRIAGFLEPSAAACLALTSKSFLKILGTPQFRTQPKSKMPFLNLIQRDLPQDQWLECYHCKKLHPFDLCPSDAKTWTYRPDGPCDAADSIAFLLPSVGIRFRYIQMAMKLHKNGMPDTDNNLLKSLSHTRRAPHHKDSLAHTSVRIADNSLFIKLEYRILLRREESFERVLSMRPQVCPHWRCEVGQIDVPCRSLSQIIRNQIKLHEEQYIPDYVSLTDCIYCETEFAVACLDCKWTPGGKAVYITAWKNYGNCIRPQNHKWRSHIPPFGHLWYRRKQSKSMLGSIRQTFEQSRSPDNGRDGLTKVWPLRSDAKYQELVTTGGI